MCSGMRATTVRNMTNESGQTNVEYALVLSLVGVVLAGSLVALNVPFGDLVNRIVDQITSLV
jgi:Flp pilus assembly pilin Flp